MDQLKTGRFIAQCRKEKDLTQLQLGEMLGISDRAVSKWERGLSLPDASIMQDLCDILGITVNELFTGERLEQMNDYDKNAEKNLLEMKKQEEERNRQLLNSEVAILALSLGTMLSASIVMFRQGLSQNWKHIGLGELLENPEFLLPIAVAFAGIGYASQLEWKAGYYQCRHCGHAQFISAGMYVRSLHLGRNRWLTCPECGKKSWQKKVLTKDD